MKNRDSLKVALVSLQQDAERIPPVGLVYIATYLRDVVGLRGDNIKILEKNYSNIEEDLAGFSPDIIAFGDDIAALLFCVYRP